MQLTPGTSIENSTTVTRQTLYDLVYNAIGGTVQASDLHTSVLTVAAQSSVPTPYPGLLWYDQTDQLAKVYTDMIDGTGCSLWLSIGPDRFDVAVLATEPIPFGAAVQFTGTGRKVSLPPDWPLLCKNTNYTNMRFEHLKIVGFNNDNNNANHTISTAASGTWFAMGALGIVWAWHVLGDTNWTAGGGNHGWVGFPSSFSALTGPSGYTAIRGGMVPTNVTAVVGAGGQLAAIARGFHQTTLKGAQPQAWARVLFTVPCCGRWSTTQA